MQISTVRQRYVDLGQAADRLGVHYQTAYKWVRSGKLPAARVNGRYAVDTDDIERLKDERSRPAPRRTRKPRGGYAQLAGRAFKMLVTGDEDETRKLTASLVDNGVPITEVISEVFVPALQEVGRQWHAGRLDVGTEHRCSAVVERMIGENMPNPRGRRRGTAVVTAPEGDMHSLPTSMAAAALRQDNWKVQHLGANMPTEEIVEFCAREEPDLVVLTVTAPESRPAAQDASEQLEAARIPTLIGGSGQTLAELTETARKAKRS